MVHTLRVRMFTDRGTDNLASEERIDVAMAEALKNEARRRVDAGSFFGFIGFASLIVHRPQARLI